MLRRKRLVLPSRVPPYGFLTVISLTIRRFLPLTSFSSYVTVTSSPSLSLVPASFPSIGLPSLPVILVSLLTRNFVSLSSTFTVMVVLPFFSSTLLILPLASAARRIPTARNSTTNAARKRRNIGVSLWGLVITRAPAPRRGVTLGCSGNCA